MKTLKSIVAGLLIVFVPIMYSGCEDTGTDESCEQQDMNEILTCDGETNVEVCCVAGAECVYKFNGTEYPDTADGLNDLADALGCTYKSLDAQEAEKELIIQQLIVLRDKAKAGLY
jgi:hypothetical protein